MYKVSVPYKVQWGKKKKTTFYLNLNNYRNAHFHVLNKAKELFYEMVAPLLCGLQAHRKVGLTYTLYPGTNALCDTANICCIVDKFFSDVLVGEGKIPDDNYQIVKTVAFKFGNVDKGNGRVEISIEPMDDDTGSTAADNEHSSTKKEKTMQITLVQKEIEQAIRNYVTGTMSVQSNKRIDITFKATRGDAGYQAFVDIVDTSLDQDSLNQNQGNLAQGDAASTSTAPQAAAQSQPKAEPEVSGEASGTAKPSLFAGAKEVVNA